MHYIEMDCHITTLDFAVVNEAGRLIKAQSVSTSVNGLVGFVKKIPPLRTIYMEEGSLAAWALETCVRYGEKLVITDAKKNSWIGSSMQSPESRSKSEISYRFADWQGNEDIISFCKKCLYELQNGVDDGISKDFLLGSNCYHRLS